MTYHWYKMATSKSYRKHRWVGKNFSSYKNAIKLACAAIEGFPEWLTSSSLLFFIFARSSFVRRAAMLRLTDMIMIQYLKLEEYREGRLDDTL